MLRTRLCFLLLLLFTFVLQSSVASAAEEEIRTRRFQTLLQYRPKLFGLLGQESLIDDPDFFFAPAGRSDLGKERAATLAAMAEEEEFFCVHPARGRLLSPQSPVPEVACPRLEKWLAGLDAAQLTLVYPAAYLNNPASMFGHTLLRIDSKDSLADRGMLAYAANYGAMTNETSGIAFAINGLFGGYVGSFTIGPYYRLIEKYSDREHRDIWEYHLSFDAQETRELLELLWEYGSTYSQYYFLEENCSFQLLFLFDFLRPELELVDEFPLWAIPSDTVKAVTSREGLIASVDYRPSAATILRHQVREAEAEIEDLAEALSEGRLSPEALAPERAAAALELSSNLLSYQIMRSRDEERRSELANRAHRLLVARSSLPSGSAFSAVPRPSVRPDEGHRSLRLSTVLGVQEEQLYTEHGVRLAYHDLLDPQGGYVDGAAISVFDLRLRVYDAEGLRFERFAPLEISSLAMRDRFIKPVSWFVRTAVERRYRSKDDSFYLGELRGGPGLAYEVGESGLLWSLLDFGILYGGALEQGTSTVLAGVRAGLHFDLKQELRILFETGGARTSLGEHSSELKGVAALRYTLSPGLALVFEGERSAEFGYFQNRLQSSVRLYF